MSADAEWEDIFYRVSDGIKLYARCYPAHGSQLRPVVCLPGLTRNSRDFHDLALALSTDARSARTVYAVDYRGRGLSQWESDWKNYTIPHEAQDVIDFFTSRGLHGSAVIGTSRGGLIAMVMAALQPTALGPVVLNDIGPVIEGRGLIRIASHMSTAPVPPSWEDAALQVRNANHKAFPVVPEADWAVIARQFFNEKDGRPAAGYDPMLGRIFSVKDGVAPPLWAQFLALKGRAVLVIRGENSDLLSRDTVSAMQSKHPTCTAIEVAGQGHAPLLRDAPTIQVIADFLRGQDPPSAREIAQPRPAMAATAGA